MRFTRRQKIITGLDMGTTKICAIIGQIDEDNQLSILGVGSNPSHGLRKGIVVSIDETVDSIQRAVSKAEQMANTEVRDVYVGITGAHLTSMNNRAMVEVGNPTRGVTRADLARVLDKAKSVSLPPDRDIVKWVRQTFLCDDAPCYQEPLGKACSKLELKLHIVNGSINTTQNIIRCVNMGGFRTADVLPESLASSLATIDNNEKDLGVILMDIGGGTTDIAVFTNGCIQFTGVLPFGGDNITSDIAIGLRVSPYDAENIKKKYGHAMSSAVSQDETFEIQRVLNQKRERVKKRFLCEIIQLRLEEILLIAKEMIDATPYSERVFAGIVLTGGTALLSGIVELTEKVFDLPVKVGVPQGLKGLSGVVSSPIYSTGIGMVLWGLNPESAAYANHRTIPRMILNAARRLIDIYA
jgi:cell division protein FtsA